MIANAIILFVLIIIYDLEHKVMYFHCHI